MLYNNIKIIKSKQIFQKKINIFVDYTKHYI